MNDTSRLPKQTSLHQRRKQMPIHTKQPKGGIQINQDNRRLKDIQQYKQAYTEELDRAETIADCIAIQKYISDLEEEEKEILARGGVKI